MSEMSDLPGSAGVPPAQGRHSFAYLSHFDKPGTAPFPVYYVKDVPGLYPDHSPLKGARTAAAGLPLADHSPLEGASQKRRDLHFANHSPLKGKSQKLSRQAKADAVGGGRRPARLRPAATPPLPETATRRGRNDSQINNPRAPARWFQKAA